MAAFKRAWSSKRAARTELAQFIESRPCFDCTGASADDHDSCRLYYSDDEVEAAPRGAVKRKRGPVDFPLIMDVLAPGEYSQKEAARVSQALLRLSQDGKAARLGSLWGADAY